MDKKTLIIVFGILIVLLVASWLFIGGQSNQVTVQVTPEDRQMMQNMMPGMTGNVPVPMQAPTQQ